MNTYAGLIILICGFVLGDVAGLNRYLIRRNENRKKGMDYVTNEELRIGKNGESC